MESRLFAGGGVGYGLLADRTLHGDRHFFDGLDDFDGLAGEPRGGCDVVVENGRVREVAEGGFSGQAEEVIDAGGRFVMPGLIDAHFHAYGIDLNPMVMDRMLPGLRALHARRILEDSLQRGFTTIRDAAGGDVALATAVRQGLIKGPRLFYPGMAISQTGGHGDMRAPDHFAGCACGYCGSMTVLADGPEEMRKAVREQLRQGADQIKLFVSGGVLSPSDPICKSCCRRKASTGSAANIPRILIARRAWNRAERSWPASSPPRPRPNHFSTSQGCAKSR